MKVKYLFRLDDACPTMDLPKWEKFFNLFDRYGVKPLIAVIPNNEDAANMLAPPLDNFWERVVEWGNKGYQIALHGYNHVYTTEDPGMVSLNKFSEFAGVDKKVQAEKIAKGYKLFIDNGITPDVWIAPGHSFDENTLTALESSTNIRVISDGFSIFPYISGGFFWLPQQLWDVKEKRNGVWTVCYHPNVTSDAQLARLENFLARNAQNSLTSLSEIVSAYSNRKRSVRDRFYACNIYFWHYMKSFLSKH